MLFVVHEYLFGTSGSIEYTNLVTDRERFMTTSLIERPHLLVLRGSFDET